MAGRTTRAFLAAAALLHVVGCGGDDADEAFPTQNWSGVYAIQVQESSTDCEGAKGPPPLGGLMLEVRQTLDNEVGVSLGPVVSLLGRMSGDALVASGDISQPISLPESLLGRATASDSLETIGYRLDVTFESEYLEGRYQVRAPDLVALARGAEKRRCSYDYQIRGVPLSRVGPLE
jgi:hypothetical protein